MSAADGMTRKNVVDGNYVSFVVDDALSGRELNADMHAIVREAGEHPPCNEDNDDQNVDSFSHPSVLVGWQCGFEPLFVAVHSHMGAGADYEIDDEEAEELATDYLRERGWFGDNEREPDYIIR